MIVKFRGHKYNVLFKFYIVPYGIEEVISEFQGAPKDYKLVLNGGRLKDKVALVTGASKGIGYHIALRLLKDGAKVIITGRNERMLKQTVDHLHTSNIAYLVWDIADGKAVDHFEEAVKKYGRIDILVNNAGVNKVNDSYMNFETATTDYIHKMSNINVMGTISLCESFVNKYSEGTILNILSNTAMRSATGIYWMSKWAVLDYTRGLSDILKGSHSCITVNGLCPGPTKTDMMFHSSSTVYYPSMANKRIGLPEEIAELAFVQILSGLNGQTGEIVVCDGGESLN